MPLFRFEVRTPGYVIASDGGEFANSTAARVVAAKRIGELLVGHAEDIWADEDWQMIVTDEIGLILYMITVSASRSPATHGR